MCISVGKESHMIIHECVHLQSLNLIVNFFLFCSSKRLLLNCPHYSSILLLEYCNRVFMYLLLAQDPG